MTCPDISYCDVRYPKQNANIRPTIPTIICIEPRCCYRNNLIQTKAMKEFLLQKWAGMEGLLVVVTRKCLLSKVLYPGRSCPFYSLGLFVTNSSVFQSWANKKLSCPSLLLRHFFALVLFTCLELMGVKNLWEILTPVARPVQLDSLRQRKLAIDASIWLYHFLKAVRDKEGNALKNAHIVGFFRRICKLLFYNIRPVFVFDGGAPALKRLTIESICQLFLTRFAWPVLVNNHKSFFNRKNDESGDQRKQRT